MWCGVRQVFRVTPELSAHSPSGQCQSIQWRGGVSTTFARVHRLRRCDGHRRRRGAVPVDVCPAPGLIACSTTNAAPLSLQKFYLLIVSFLANTTCWHDRYHSFAAGEPSGRCTSSLATQRCGCLSNATFKQGRSTVAEKPKHRQHTKHLISDDLGPGTCAAVTQLSVTVEFDCAVGCSVP